MVFRFRIGNRADGYVTGLGSEFHQFLGDRIGARRRHPQIDQFVFGNVGGPGAAAGMADDVDRSAGFLVLGRDLAKNSAPSRADF